MVVKRVEQPPQSAKRQPHRLSATPIFYYKEDAKPPHHFILIFCKQLVSFKEIGILV